MKSSMQIRKSVHDPELAEYQSTVLIAEVGKSFPHQKITTQPLVLSACGVVETSG